MAKRWGMGIGVAITAAFAILAIGFWLRGGRRSPSARPVADESSLLAFAEEQRARGDLEGYVKTLDRIPEDSPRKAAILVDQAFAYRRMGRAAAFERALVAAVKRTESEDQPTPIRVAALGALAEHLAVEERYDEAREVCWRLLEAADRGQKEMILARLTGIEDDRFDPSQSIAWHEQFAAQDAHDWDTRRALGINLARLGKWPEASRHLRDCYEQNPGEWRYIESWLWFQIESGDIAGAGAALKDLGNRFDDRPEIWITRGTLAEHQRRDDDAAAAFSKAAELEPGRLSAISRLAQALRAAGRSDEHAAAMKKVLEIARARRALYGLRQQILKNPETLDAASRRKMAELCATLGLAREAAAWKELQ